MSATNNSNRTARLIGNVPSHSQIPDRTTKSPTKLTPSRVDETAITTWLGGSDLADASRAVESAATSKAASLATRSVASPQSLSDDEVLRQVADRLIERNIPSFTRIGLDVRNGVITAYGNVASKGERLLLVYLLRTTPGVRKVNDGLTIVRPRTGKRQWGQMAASVSAAISELASQIRPLHAAAVLVCLSLLGSLWWPRGSARPVAVYPIKGRVVMDGVALPQASVVLHPVGNSKLPKGIQPRGIAESDGGFAVETFASADGAPEGEFVATVHLLKSVVVDGDSIPGPNLLPIVYSRPETSPFRMTITRETREIAVLELHKTGVQ